MSILDPNPLLVSFEEYLTHVRRASANTVKAYVKDVRRFLSFTGKVPGELNRVDVETFVKALSKGQVAGEVSESTISRYISSLKVFFDYLNLMGLLKQNPAEKVRHPRVRKKVPSFLSPDEVRRMLSSFGEHELRAKAIVATLYFCGLRVSELCNTRVEDVSFHPPFLRVVMGKGNKDRIVPLSQGALEILIAYFDKYKPSGFFFGKNGAKPHPSTVFRVVKRAALRAGISKNVHPHTLRHSFATHLVMNNVNVKIVQELLGHANLSTTSIYLHVADREKFEAVRRLVI